MDDRELITAYVRDRSDAAFGELVRRHLAWVYSVALRHVGNPALAEDVAQSVFVLLARKAESLRSQTVLGGWLFRTTRFVANRALRSETRRRLREQTAASMIPTISTPQANESLWDRLAPEIDEAVASLCETDRRAIMLRFYEKKPLGEIGGCLGLSEEAAKKRVQRAIEKVRAFLMRRGVTVGTTILAEILLEHAVQAVPSGLASSVLKTTTTAVSSSATMPPLAEETLAAWRWTRLKLVGGVTASLCAIAWICFVLSPSALIGNSKPAEGPEITAELKAATAPAADRTPLTNQRVLQFRVVAKDSGEPVSNVPLAVNDVSEGNWKQRFDLSTDDSGNAIVPYSSATTRLDVGVVASGWNARFATWWTDLDGKIPTEYTMRLDRQTNFMGGWLRTENGEPVPNAIVEMEFGSSDMAQEENPRERPGFVGPAPIATSDQNGWWSSAVVNPNGSRIPGVRAKHPNFAPTQIAFASSLAERGTRSHSSELLWNGKLVTTMNEGVALTGRIIDPKGEVVPGARIEHAPNSMEYLVAESDLAGSFTIPGLPPGSFDFIVTAPGFAQKYVKVDVQTGMNEVQVRLAPGGVLRLLVVDENGNPIENATAALTGPGGMYVPGINWSGQTGPDGRIEWTSAQSSSLLTICASKSPEYGMSRAAVKADAKEHVIRLQPKFAVTGAVLDARTGRPVHGEIKAFPGYGNGLSSWYRGETRRSTDGTFRVYFEGGESPWRYRVEAEGYSPFVAEITNIPGSGIVTNVFLQPTDPSKTVRGRVLGIDGSPAAVAQVALLTPLHGAFLGRGCFARRAAVDDLIVDTDGAGHFAFPEEPHASIVVAVSSNGFARVPVGDLKSPMEIQLQPWGRIEGSIDPSAHTRPVDFVVVDDLLAMDAPGSLMLEREDFQTKPALDGRFSFDQVPPGLFCVWLTVDARIERTLSHPIFHHPVWVQVSSAEVSNIKIADTGYSVKGRFVVNGLKENREKQRTYAALEREWPPQTGHAAAFRARQWMRSFFDLGRLIIEPDGRFATRDSIDPGTYRLLGKIYGIPVDQMLEVPTPDSSGLISGALDPEAAEPNTIDLGDIVVRQSTPSSNKQ